MIRRRGYIRKRTPAEKRARTIARKAKAATLGHPLVRYGVVLKAADDLWSVLIRALVDRCVVCNVPSEPKARQCAHGWSREIHPVRFSFDNTFSACAPCHRRHTPPGPAWDDWLRKHLGDRYELTRTMAQVRGKKWSEDDLRMLLLETQLRIAALPSGENKAWALERQEAILKRLNL